VTHVLTTTLNALVTQVTGLTTTGARVFKERPDEHALQASELPCLRVSEESETATQAGMAATWTYQRTPVYRIEALTKQVTGYGDTLRQIAEEVETALGSTFTMAGKRFAAVYLQSDVGQTGEGDQVIAIRRMRFGIQHIYTASNAPGTFT
jgi:hypothetical protein